MKTIPERATKIKELIREALTKKYNCSPVERADKLYADVEYQFRKIHEQQVKNLNIPAVIKSVCSEGNIPIDCNQFLALGSCLKCKYNQQTVL